MYTSSYLQVDSVGLELQPQNSFQLPKVFTTLNGSKRVIQIQRGDEIRAIFPGHVDESTGMVSSSPLSYRQGLIYSSKHLLRTPSKTVSEQMLLVESLLSFFEQKGIVNFQISLSSDELDVRPWSWVLGRLGWSFRVEPRYTAVLRLADRSEKQVWESFRPVRRQEIRKFSRNLDVATVTAAEVADALLLKLELDGPVDNEALRELRALRMVAGNPAFTATSYSDGISGARHYVLSLTAAGEKHLISNFDAVGPRVNGLHARSTHAEINKGMEEAELFDFNGANSPQRGDDKHSYGAEAVLYFEISGSKRG